MAMTLGTRGEDGRSLVRNAKKFKKRFDDIDWSKRPKRKPTRVSGGKKRYVYG
jgi:hypothetical protein